jgi:serine/threonine-protein kinase
VLAGRYRLKHLIANGGMAEVWEAVDDILGRPVAVKILHSHLAEDESFQERFRREAIAAARLAHPGVVATFDTGVDGAVTFIVMELVNGQTLRQALNETGPMAPGRVVHIGAQVADALDYAHKSGVVHRDVKPANILLCSDGRLKVADFGIAKAVEESEPSRPDPAEALTGTGSIVGTAQYLSPEQVEGRAVDGRTDVYALGVVLYEMLTGRPPFSGETDMAVALQHVTTEPPGLRQVRAGVPPALEAVVRRAMAKAPGARYQSAADLGRALQSVDLSAQEATNVVAPPAYVAPVAPPVAPVADTPPHGIPPTVVGSQRRWMVPAVAIVAVVVTLAVVGILFARSDAGHRLLNGTGTSGQPAATGQAIPRPTVSAFDPPPGDLHEHDSDLNALVDGDPSTAWSTEQYVDSHLTGLKPGVGVVFTLDGSHKLGRLRLTSPTRGWSAQVFVADAAKSTLSAWGAPVASNGDVGGGETSFDLNGRSGAAVLLWITDLGDTNSSVSISEVTISSS